MKKRFVFGGVVAVLTAYFIFWPTPIEPVAWNAPENKGFSGRFEQNNALLPLRFIPIEGDFGPEDIAINSAGEVAISLHSGAIMKLNPSLTHLSSWVNTQGRPLGIEFDQYDNLLVADAYKGLLSINPDGKMTLLADRTGDLPIRYADDVDISKRTGKVYFSDASTRFGAEESGGTLEGSLLDLMEHSLSGRVIEYDPVTGESRTLIEGLSFANGVAVTHDEHAILVNETGEYRVLRYWIEGTKKGQLEVLIDNLPGFPDNIARAANGGYWLGLASPRSSVLDGLSDSPALRKALQKLPSFMRPKAQAYGHIVKINDNGDVVETLQDPSGSYPLTTGALETDNGLIISSLTSNTIAIKSR